MKIVDLQDGTITSVSSQYFSVPQPMFIYDNFEEFQQNEIVSKAPRIIQDQSEYIEFIKACDFKITNRYEDVSRLNVWLKTQDEFIPETADMYGNITYRKNKDGERIPTTGCFIRLFKIYTRTSKHFLYTSSGIHTVSLIKYKLTGAKKDQFMVDFRVPRTKQSYQDRLQKELEKTKPNIKHTRLFHLLFNPSVPEYFLNFDKAIAKIWGGTVRKEDRMKILTTKAFKETFMRELKYLMPGLTDALQKEIPVDELAKSVKQILKNAVEKEGSEKALDVVDYIVDNAYLADPNTPVGRIPEPNHREIEPYQDEDVNTLETIKDASNKNVEENAISEEERKEAKGALDYSEEMIMAETETGPVELEKDDGTN